MVNELSCPLLVCDQTTKVNREESLVQVYAFLMLPFTCFHLSTQLVHLTCTQAGWRDGG